MRRTPHHRNRDDAAIMKPGRYESADRHSGAAIAVDLSPGLRAVASDAITSFGRWIDSRARMSNRRQ
jgi:hypothetical protein